MPSEGATVSEEGQDPGLRERISRQGEEALGKIAEELAGNPMVTGALSRAFEAREKALQAQEAAMGAPRIPSGAGSERRGGPPGSLRPPTSSGSPAGCAPFRSDSRGSRTRWTGSRGSRAPSTG